MIWQCYYQLQEVLYFYKDVLWLEQDKLFGFFLAVLALRYSFSSK